ncbi:protein tramtrack, alpha isoform isoform X1 [Anabrus simplex]|uniref:protein tramtrack, alpha isoform isoform X1 n=1 Tax=Anabrus simplex TaxID=316456 RepID=UPI0035A38C9F
MSIQQFCLRWNNHQPNFISVFTTLLNSESLVDVTLAAEGRHLQAHRVVLSACSSYFQSLFTVNPCQHPIVILKDVKYDDLKIMVDFMYYGEVNVSQEQLPAILKTAEMLKIKGLAEMPEHSTSGSVHMLKSQSSSSDKAELLTPGDSTWGSDSARRSPSPMSPSMRRKRLRKSSTGSGSGSTERTSEELPSEITLISSPALVKPEPTAYTPDGESGGRSDGSLRNSTQEPSTDSEPREGSQDSVEEDPLNMQMSHDSSTGVGETPIADTGPVPSTSQQPMTSQGGLQWTLLEHGYPRFALSSCQGSISVQGTSAFCAPEPPSTPSVARRDGPQYAGPVFQPHQMLPATSCGTVGPYGSSSPSAPSSPWPNSCISPCASPCASPVAASQHHRRKRSSNPQADENFVRALEAVRLGGMGFCKAARMYGVNNRTLWLEYKKRGYPITRPSLKARVKQDAPTSSSPPCVKQEVRTSTSPSSQSTNNAPEQSMPVSTASPAICPPPPTTGMVGGFMDTRHVEFAHPQGPSPPRPRFQDSAASLNSTPMNYHGMSFNPM